MAHKFDQINCKWTCMDTINYNYEVTLMMDMHVTE